MSDILNLLTALGLSSGAHTYGHVQAGNKLNVPVNIDFSALSERYNTRDIKKDSEIASGGFNLQDKLSQAMSGTDLKDDIHKVNAAYKLGYLLGIKPGAVTSDFDVMQRSSGNKATKGLLGLSALFDLYKSQKPNTNFDLQFIAPDGAPGLLGSWRF